MWKPRSLHSSVRAGIVLLAVLCAAPVQADWLVTRDGAKIETKGTWEVRGPLIVFTKADGTLSSLRASEVDLDASAIATEEANNPVEAPPPPPPKAKVEPTIVITNDDVGRGTLRAPAAGEEEGEENEEEADEAEAPSSLVVQNWEVEYPSDFNGLMVVGRLANTSGKVVGQAELQVSIFDDNGAELASGKAFLGRSAVPPGDSVVFRFPVEDVAFAPRVEFKASGVEVFLNIKSEDSEDSDDDDLSDDFEDSGNR